MGRLDRKWPFISVSALSRSASRLQVMQGHTRDMQVRCGRESRCLQHFQGRRAGWRSVWGGHAAPACRCVQAAGGSSLHT